MLASIKALLSGGSRAARRREERAAQRQGRARVGNTELRLEALEERAVFAVGDIDPNFGSAGVVANTDYTWNSQAVQGDGKIVVVGAFDTGVTKDVAVMRLNANGTVDTSFGGGDGIVTFDLGASGDVATDVAIDQNGDIVVVGTQTTGSNATNAFAMRLDTVDGSLDTSFDADGIATFSLGNAVSAAQSVAIDSANRVVIAGRTLDGANFDAVVARLTSTGSLDTTFNGTGIVSFDGVNTNDFFNAVAVRADNSIVAVGNMGTGAGSDILALGLTEAGGLDLSFSPAGIDGDGVSIINVATNAADYAYDAAFDTSGRLVIAGSTLLSGVQDMTAIRLNTNGTIDTSFGGGDGIATVDFDGAIDAATGVAIDPLTNNVVLVGSAGNSAIGIVRLLGTTGALDTAFNADGKSILNLGNSSIGRAAALTSTGAVVLTANGIVNTGFGFSSVGSVLVLANPSYGLTVDGNVDGDVAVDVNEGAAVNTVVANLTGTGFDQGANLTYTLTSNPDNLFAIVNGQLVVNGVLDFETAATRTVTVQVSDGVNTVSQQVVVTINNLAPGAVTDANAAVNNVTVGATAGAIVGVTGSATDPAGGTVTYSLTNNANGRFVIDSSTGVVSVANGAVIDAADVSYTITVRASDGSLASTEDFTINVVSYGLTVDGAVDGDVAVDVNEGAAVNTPIANLNGTGFAQGASLTYSLTSNPNNLFAIVSGQLVVNGSINYETAATQTVTVQVTDGTNTYSQDVVVTVNNLAPSVVADVNGAVNSVNVGAAAGTVVGLTGLATDPAGGTVTYSLTNNANGRFVIDPSTGVVTVANGAVFNQADGSYGITVRASDGSLSTDTNFSITVATVVQTNTVFTAADPVNGAVTSLFVYGTEGADAIKIGYKNGQYIVKMNGAFVGGSYTLTSDARIYVYGLGGNDSVIELDSSAVNSAVMDGGEGNDFVYGGAADDVLLGGGGNDYLDGRGGRDVIIGGTGIDKLFGEGAGSTSAREGNILIGDSTNFDADLQALAAISAAWSGNAAGSETLIRTYLNSATVIGDGSSDAIRGTTLGIDWAFAFELNGSGARLDSIANFSGNDLIN